MSHSRSPSAHLLSSPTVAAPVATTSAASASNRLAHSARSPILNIPSASASSSSAVASSSARSPRTPSHPMSRHSISGAPYSPSTTSALPVNEKGTDRMRSSTLSRSTRPDLHRLDIVSEKLPSPLPPFTAPSSSPSRAQPGPSPCRSDYPPTNPNSVAESSCGWFSNLSPRVRLWLSFGAWGATSVGFILAIAFWKEQVFTGLDNLSHWLVAQGWMGNAIIFGLIFVTTIPPLPLYSTLMMLSGYTYGTWEGFLISYAASLTGAVVVFFLSRRYLGKSLVNILAHSPTVGRTVRAVAKNPQLLFLVRLAPYPYNVMNVLLAACPSLTMKRYIGCTGLSLLKTVVHTSIGAGIHSFAGYYGVGAHEGEQANKEGDNDDHVLARWFTIIGGVLCVALLGYLSYVARRAVDEELEGEEDCSAASGSGEDVVLPTHHHRGRRHQRLASTAEERVAFLSPIGRANDGADSDSEERLEMGESEINHRLGGLTIRSRSPSFDARSR